jgi:hypothetical protein
VTRSSRSLPGPRALLEQPGAGGNAGLAAASPPPAWPGFRPLAVTALTPESESVVSVYLADPGGAAVTADPAPLLRSYSLSGSPDAETYRISVKREPHGAGSQFIHAACGRRATCSRPPPRVAPSSSGQAQRRSC